MGLVGPYQYSILVSVLFQPNKWLFLSGNIFMLMFVLYVGCDADKTDEVTGVLDM